MTTTIKPNETPQPKPPEPGNDAERKLLEVWERNRGADWVQKHGNRILREARALGEVLGEVGPALPPKTATLG